MGPVCWASWPLACLPACLAGCLAQIWCPPCNSCFHPSLTASGVVCGGLRDMDTDMVITSPGPQGHTPAASCLSKAPYHNWQVCGGPSGRVYRALGIPSQEEGTLACNNSARLHLELLYYQIWAQAATLTVTWELGEAI